MPFTQNTSPTFAKQPRHGLAQILPADTTAQKTVITAGANGSKVMSLYASSTDTVARDVQIAIVRSATTYILGTVTVPLSSGNTAAAPTVDLFNVTAFPFNGTVGGVWAVDHDGQHYLNLESGDTLVVSVLVTVTAAKVISVHSEFEDF